MMPSGGARRAFRGLGRLGRPLSLATVRGVEEDPRAGSGDLEREPAHEPAVGSTRPRERANEEAERDPDQRRHPVSGEEHRDLLVANARVERPGGRP